MPLEEQQGPKGAVSTHLQMGVDRTKRIAVISRPRGRAEKEHAGARSKSRLTEAGVLRSLLVFALLFAAGFFAAGVFFAAVFLAAGAFLAATAFFAGAFFAVAVFFTGAFLAAEGALVAFAAAGLASAVLGPASLTGPELPDDDDKVSGMVAKAET